jgi:hypothetical protein
MLISSSITCTCINQRAYDLATSARKLSQLGVQPVPVPELYSCDVTRYSHDAVSVLAPMDQSPHRR